MVYICEECGKICLRVLKYEKDGKIIGLCQECFEKKVQEKNNLSINKTKDQIDYLTDIVKRLVETTNNLRSDINYLKSELKKVKK
jgi:radical SAM superfamily enzyme with C-terminal helix-hairpin-helix motif